MRKGSGMKMPGLFCIVLPFAGPFNVIICHLMEKMEKTVSKHLIIQRNMV